MIGKRFSRYQILEKIGEGGMGKVYLAEDTELKRKVAIKMLVPQFTSDEDIKIRFKREAQAAAALNHPNIITIYEIGESEWGMFIAMEFVEGTSLRNYIEEDKLTIFDALEFSIQICEGINEAHQAGIIHRDIKSDNIIINDKGRVKILDFGLAKLKQVSTITGKSVTLGTLQYMSPEQINNKNVDHRSDIFSLGVVLYEMIAGHLPFEGEYKEVIIYSILNEDPEPLARYKSNVSVELQRIISKALEKNQETRYQHIDDLLSDLKKEKENNIHSKSEKQTKSLTSEPTGRPERKLSAIMFTDIVGFSSMMGKNEEETLRLLHDYSLIAGPTIKNHNGYILKEVGDGLFCEFPSAINAADCALQIQKALNDFNQSGPEDFRLEVRIGIHLGDVVKKGNDLFGDGVNVTARIEPLAPPGGILVTESIFSAICSHPKYNLKSIGSKKLKGISHQYCLYKLVVDKENERSPSKKIFYGIVILLVFILLATFVYLEVINVDSSSSSVSSPVMFDIDKGKDFLSQINKLNSTKELWDFLLLQQQQGNLTFGQRSDFFDLDNKFVIIADEQEIYDVLLFKNGRFISTKSLKECDDLSSFTGKRTIWIELF